MMVGGNQIRCYCLGEQPTTHGIAPCATQLTKITTKTWTEPNNNMDSLELTHLSKTSRTIKMQNATGHARYRSSACGNVASSVFFRSAQVTLWGSQKRSFQNQARIPDMAVSARRPTRGQQADKRSWRMGLTESVLGRGDGDESGPPLLCAYGRLIGSRGCHSGRRSCAERTALARPNVNRVFKAPVPNF
uniref:Uncharacterized protein n=1 Tax=Knipowitschia caucasica TaxID=637954 RepID=A0AAV2K1A0_KNICA